MGKTTDWVRRAMDALGAEATNQEVKNWIRHHQPEVPEAHVALALRNLRPGTVPTDREDLFADARDMSDQPSLFSSD
jgi:hypothetical protein